MQFAKRPLFLIAALALAFLVIAAPLAHSNLDCEPCHIQEMKPLLPQAGSMNAFWLVQLGVCVVVQVETNVICTTVCGQEWHLSIPSRRFPLPGTAWHRAKEPRTQRHSNFLPVRLSQDHGTALSTHTKSHPKDEIHADNAATAAGTPRPTKRRELSDGALSKERVKKKLIKTVETDLGDDDDADLEFDDDDVEELVDDDDDDDEGVAEVRLLTFESLH